jgi:sigma-B regulation protein RsbU (phosphoserine phosphatase)
MLMAQLHGVFRTLIPLEEPLDKMLARASRVFCESTMPTHFATLICGKASPSGEVKLCNAGHLPPLLANGKDVVRLDSTSLPIGMFCDEEFTVQNVNLGKGDSLVLLTDGVSEARSSSGTEYGLDRLSEQVGERHRLPPQALIDALMEDLRSFRSGAPKADDLSIMAIRRMA